MSQSRAELLLQPRDRGSRSRLGRTWRPPLTVCLLQRQKTRAEAFGRGPCACRFPNLRRFAHDIAFHLPAQRRIRVEQPGDYALSDHIVNLAVPRAKAGDDVAEAERDRLVELCVGA